MDDAAASAGSPRRASLTRWMVLLGLAEAIGMTAAAGAAKAGQALTAGSHSGWAVAAALTLATLAGMVEGAAVALAMAAVLRPIAPGLPARRWCLVTILVAGAGWLAGSTPGLLMSADSSAQPPMPLVLAGAAAIGLAMGATLGVAQALVLRERVPHPWRWAGASALAWAPAMTIIFAGATAPGASWGVLPVVAAGVLTGATAGAALGLVLGLAAESLRGPSLGSRIMLIGLTSPVRALMPSGLLAIAVRGRRTGVWHRFPVMVAHDEDAIVVVPGRPQAKQWWRNLSQPSRVAIHRDGSWVPADAWLLHRDEQGYASSLRAYRRRYPRTWLEGSPLIVRIVPARPAPSTGGPAQPNTGHRSATI